MRLLHFLGTLLIVNMHKVTVVGPENAKNRLSRIQDEAMKFLTLQPGLNVSVFHVNSGLLFISCCFLCTISEGPKAMFNSISLRLVVSFNPCDSNQCALSYHDKQGEDCLCLTKHFRGISW